MKQLKVYQAKEFRDSWLPRDTEKLLGVRHDQGDWYIVAYTAIEAVEIARTADVPFVSGPRSLRVAGKGVYAELLKSFGYLATPGEVIVHKSTAVTPVVKFIGGWSIIGRFEYDATIRQTVFTPEEG